MVNKKPNTDFSSLILIVGISLITIAFFGFLSQPDIPAKDFSNVQCGDNRCESPEDSLACPIDCGPPLAQCGNQICESSETQFSCPIDCELTQADADIIIPASTGCGNEICESDESASSCPIDCGSLVKGGIACPFGVTNQCFDNKLLIPELNRRVRPIEQGISFFYVGTDSYSTCTMGAIIQSGGKNYILTAGHCVTSNPMVADSGDIGHKIYQDISGDNLDLDSSDIVGTVSKIDGSKKVDVALIEIQSDVPFETISFLGDSINGFTYPQEGMKVYKIGKTTGLTFGTIVKLNTTYRDNSESRSVRRRGFVVESDNNEPFVLSGDSGSAIMTFDNPSQIVGIASVKLGDGRKVVSPYPSDIINTLGILST